MITSTRGNQHEIAARNRLQHSRWATDPSISRELIGSAIALLLFAVAVLGWAVVLP